MASILVEFPLSLHPVVRSREAGDRDGGHVQYHAAIWIVDHHGRRIMDVAPDINDVRGGRLRDDPLELVSRASGVVAWLQSLNRRLGSWIDSSSVAKGLALRPIIIVGKQGRTVEAGIQFCSAPDDEFDRVTRDIRVLAGDSELEEMLAPLRAQVIERSEAAATVLGKLQEAVESWRITEELAASGPDRIVIGDGSLED
jgi:hypothetical protein